MPRSNRNPGASARAEAVLLAGSPRRPDSEIAALASCTATTAAQVRRALEERGLVEHVPPGARTRHPAARMDGPARLAILALGGSASAREVADLAGCSFQGAWRMLNLGSRRPAGEQAAAFEELSVVIREPRPVSKLAASVPRSLPADLHAPVHSLDPRARPRVLAYEPDAVELACMFCTLVAGPGLSWVHAPSCPMRRNRLHDRARALNGLA